MADGPRGRKHAGWWQREFTAGADPEYEEQILPLVDRHLGRTPAGCSTSGAARGKWPGDWRRRASASSGSTRRSPDRRGPGPWRWSRVRAGAAEHSRCRGRLVRRGGHVPGLEHLDPFEPAIEEIARVLEPGGRFVLMLNHPLLQAPGSGWIDDHILERAVLAGRALPPRRPEPRRGGAGRRLPFMHRPLSRYVQVMGEVGLLIDSMDEPPPPPGFLAAAWEYEEAATIPRLLLIRARRVPVSRRWRSGPGRRRARHGSRGHGARSGGPRRTSTARSAWLRVPARRPWSRAARRVYVALSALNDPGARCSRTAAGSSRPST